ncbi:MAG: phage tail tape measure protein [Victivallaceae bacterium]|nr:phage tail tape measure protein [Victivallaceae bacterium]
MSIIDRQGIEVYLDPKGVVSGAAIARRSLQSLTLGTRNLLAGLTGVSGALGGLAIGYGIKSAIGIMADFESTMSAVEAVTGATGESFDALSDQAQELGASTKFTASQAAEGMKFLGMAGLEVNEILSAMPSMLDLASAGSLDLGRAADIASNAMSQFGLEASEMTRVADTLAFTAASSNTNIEQLAEALNYAGNVASSFGIDIETLSAAIGVLGDNGIQGSSAGTQLRQSIASLAAPTGSAATSLKEMADAAGLMPSAFEVGSQSFEDLIDNFAKARSAVGEFEFASRAFDIFGNRAAPAILALSKYNEEMRQAVIDTKEADGAAKRMADTMNRNLRGAMIEISSALQGVIINIDDKNSITGILREAAVELANIIRIFGGIQNPFVGISDGAIRLLSTIGAVPTGIKSAMDSAVDIIGVSLAVIPDLFEAAFKDAFDQAILWIERIANSMENSSVLQAFVKNNPVYSSATRAGYTPTGKNTDRGTGSITERAIPRLEEVLVKFKNDINKDTMLGVYNASKDYNKAIEENQRMFTAIRDMAEVVKGFAEDAKQFPQGVRSQTAFQAPIRSRLDVDPLRSFSEVSLIHEVKQSPEFKKAIQGVDTALYQKHIEELTKEHAAKEELINSLISQGNDLLSSRPPTLDQLRERETQILGALKQQGDVNSDNKANVEALNALLSDTRLQMESVNSQGSQFADLLEEATNLQESQIPTLDELVSKYDLINSAITEARETHGENSEEVKALNLLLSETREKIDAAKIASDGFANTWDHIKQGVDAYQDALSGLDDVPFKISQMLENVEDEITVQIMADNNIDLSSLGETIKEQIKKLAIEKMISEPIVRGLGEIVQQIGGAVMKSPIGDMIGGALGKLGGIGGVAGDIIGAMIGAEKPENYEPITASIDTLGGINQAGFDKVAAAIGDAKVAEAGKPQFEKDKTIPGQVTKEQIFQAAGIDDKVFQAKPVPQGVFKADPVYQAEPVYKADPVYQADPIFEAQPIFDAEAIFDATPIVEAISQSAESTNATTQAQTGMLGSIFNGVGSALGGVFNSVGGMLGGVFSGVGGSILGGLGGLGGSILGGLGGLGGSILGGLGGLGGSILGGLGGLGGLIGTGLSGLGGIMKSGFSGLGNALGSFASNIGGMLGLSASESKRAGGAISGAVSGAAIGASVGGPVGAVAGGIIGGIAGLFETGGYVDNPAYLSYGSNSVKSISNGVYSSPVTKTDVAHYNNMQYGSYARGGYSDNSVYSVNGFDDAPEFADGGYTGSNNGPLAGGGIPTITHPNEAIVPLPDGRNIPVEIVNNNQSNNARSVNVTINVRNSSDIMRDSVRIKRMLGEVMA